MGHWLDGLLDLGSGGGSVIIQWDGVNMPERPIVAFNGQFSASDDAANNRTIISIGPSAVAGDAMGPTNDLRLVRMRGTADSETVTVYARALQWHSTVSAGSAEISLSDVDAGALRVRHQSATTAIFAASGAVIGNAAGIQQMIGGHRLTLRAIGSGTLDATTKDTIAWIDATGERTVTLPPASVGRTLLLPFVGDNPPTLARAGTELINGVAGDYDMTGDASGGIGIAISDGTNWAARVIGASGGGPAGVPLSRAINTTAPLLGGGDLSADLTLGIDPLGYVAPSRSIVVAGPLTGGGDLSADVAIGIDTSGFLAPSRAINTTAPLLGGGDLSADLSLSLDPAGYVAPARSISVTAPLTGGGDLSANRTIGIDPAGYVAPTRSIATTAPLTGGGTLAGNLTLGINPAAYVAPTRTINTTAPLSGGGSLASDLTITIDTSSFATSTRTINTTAPLTGGGNLSADRTLAVSSATGLAVGVIQLAGNLAGSATVPLATGLTADTITIQSAALAAKGSWTNTGLRIGDATAPTEKLEIAGNVLATAASAKITAQNTNTAFDITTAAPCLVADANIAGGNAIILGIVNAIRRGSIRWDSAGNMGYNAVTTHHWFSGLTTTVPIMNASASGLRIGDTTAATQKLEVVGNAIFGSAAAKITLGGQIGSESTLAAIWMGTAAPTTTNYALLYDTSNQRTSINAIARIHMRFAGIDYNTWTSTGLRLGDTTAPTKRLEVAGNAELGKSDSTSVVNLYGGKTWQSRSISASTTLDSTSTRDQVVLVDSTSGAVTVTLPDPRTTNTGRIIWVKRVAGTNTVSVMRANVAGEVVEGTSGTGCNLITDAGGSNIKPYVALQSNGTNWYILAHFSIIWVTT